MSRSKKTRRITDIMPARKVEKRPYEKEISKPNKRRKTTRYELDLRAREEKKKRKHKGLPSGSRANEGNTEKKITEKVLKDPRLGSRKKVPLMVELINQPEKGKTISPMSITVEKTRLSPELELEQLENNECLNQLLDDLEAGKTLSAEDQKFVDECLDRVHELMTQLGIEDDDESNSETLLRQFETIDINQFR